LHIFVHTNFYNKIEEEVKIIFTVPFPTNLISSKQSVHLEEVQGKIATHSRVDDHLYCVAASGKSFVHFFSGAVHQADITYKRLNTSMHKTFTCIYFILSQLVNLFVPHNIPIRA